jgi:hypothetical protein
MDLFSTGLDETKTYCPKTEPYFIMDMMPIQDEFLSGKFTGNYSLGKR